MSRIFISHSSANNAAALALAEWLDQNGWADYFLDLDPARGLAPGERWQQALKVAADRCEAVLFLRRGDEAAPAWTVPHATSKPSWVPAREHDARLGGIAAARACCGPWASCPAKEATA